MCKYSLIQYHLEIFAEYTGSSTSQTETVNDKGDKEITTTYYYTLENDGVAGKTTSRRRSKVVALPKPSTTASPGVAGTQKSSTISQTVSSNAKTLSTVQTTAANKNSG